MLYRISRSVLLRSEKNQKSILWKRYTKFRSSLGTTSAKIGLLRPKYCLNSREIGKLFSRNTTKNYY